MFYTDNYISFLLISTLESDGYSVTRCQQVGLKDAADHIHMSFAAQHELILVTSDRGFELWNAAWNHWAERWQVSVHHAGILIVPIPSVMHPSDCGAHIRSFVAGSIDTKNLCYILRANGMWERLPAG